VSLFKESFEDIFITIRNRKAWDVINKKEMLTKQAEIQLKISDVVFGQNERILFLDLDETLIHTNFSHDSLKASSAINAIEYEGRSLQVFIRPGLLQFLEEMKKIYSLAIWTSSLKEYADRVLEIFDSGPDSFFKYRFYRDQCWKSKGYKPVKDFRIFSRSLNIENCMIVDNTPANYVNMLGHGVPILSFSLESMDFGLMSQDNELQKLGCYLKSVIGGLGVGRSFCESNLAHFKMDQ
jgi:RNA polymerase II subunit A small phosphatase-like protein